MEEASFWDDNQAAQKVIAECNQLREWTVPYQEVKEKFNNIVALLPEAEVEDPSLFEELIEELDGVEKVISELEIRKMLSGEMDDKSCFLSINAGAGGTEACDWVQMLARMYQRWAEKRGWDVEILHVLEGDVAGIKSIAMKIGGPYAYGYCRAERGIHRLVRISPFDANAKRHTSFASVDVSPEISDDITIAIRPEDLRVDTYRASGAGGQHVNKTDSAVRITHLPSGVVVSCQKERSQIQNRESCMKMLRAELYKQEVEARKSKVEQMSGEKKEIAWGHQIRSYVFQPYTLVKDARTGYEVGNIHAVMDGDIDDFILAYLKEFGA
ncbi:MAG: peptide chain release factor 2 [Verrucomicrobia bacterium]|nr:peptide chain release factor 2 [Verrucomicrobiota bacterium]